jgi:hypothetical protein
MLVEHWPETSIKRVTNVPFGVEPSGSIMVAQMAEIGAFREFPDGRAEVSGKVESGRSSGYRKWPCRVIVPAGTPKTGGWA